MSLAKIKKELRSVLATSYLDIDIVNACCTFCLDMAIHHNIATPRLQDYVNDRGTVLEWLAERTGSNVSLCKNLIIRCSHLTELSRNGRTWDVCAYAKWNEDNGLEHDGEVNKWVSAFVKEVDMVQKALVSEITAADKKEILRVPN